MTDTAILVIDMLNDFVHDGGSLVVPKAKDLIPNQRQILEFARERDMLIVYLTDSHLPDDPEFEMWPTHAVQGTDGARVIDELSPQEGDRVIPKRKYSGFYETDLDSTLREKHIERVILIGVLTDICVMYTSADASARGYQVYIVDDATGSSSEKNHKFAIEHIKSVHGAVVLSTPELITMLES